MKRFVFCFICFTISVAGYSQDDTLLVKNQKGFLFLSYFSGKYDYNGGHWRPIGFHDYFFPTDSLNINFLLDSNGKVSIKDGVRVDEIRERFYLKKIATEFQCLDTNKCYPYTQCYIIPIILTYKKFEDNWPFICGKNNFGFKITKGSEVQFEYHHKAIIVLKHSIWQ